MCLWQSDMSVLWHWPSSSWEGLDERREHCGNTVSQWVQSGQPVYPSYCCRNPIAEDISPAWTPVQKMLTIPWLVKMRTRIWIGVIYALWVFIISDAMWKQIIFHGISIQKISTNKPRPNELIVQDMLNVTPTERHPIHQYSQFYRVYILQSAFNNQCECDMTLVFDYMKTICTQHYFYCSVHNEWDVLFTK